METQNPENQPAPAPSPGSGINFGAGGHAAVAGSLTGIALAIGVPWVVLAYGQVLGQVMQSILVVMGVVAGSLVCLTSAFFGLVMPRHIPTQWTDPAHWSKWREFGENMRRFHHSRHRHHGRWVFEYDDEPGHEGRERPDRPDSEAPRS